MCVVATQTNWGAQGEDEDRPTEPRDGQTTIENETWTKMNQAKARCERYITGEGWEGSRRRATQMQNRRKTNMNNYAAAMIRHANCIHKNQRSLLFSLLYTGYKNNNTAVATQPGQRQIIYSAAQLLITQQNNISFVCWAKQNSLVANGICSEWLLFWQTPSVITVGYCLVDRPIKEPARHICRPLSVRKERQTCTYNLGRT